MEAPICIRPATLADAGIISRIIERSIRIGCALDHRNDPTTGQRLDSPAIPRIHQRLARRPAVLFEHRLADKPVGVGMATANGEITFCYVQPECFRRGVGRALMDDLEGWMRIRGASTRISTARAPVSRFIAVWAIASRRQPFTYQGLQTLPMSKSLADVRLTIDQGAKSSRRLSVSRTGKPASALRDRNAHLSGVLFWSLSIAY